MICTEKKICLGEICACGGVIELPITASDTGVYQMMAEFNGVKLFRNVSFVEGQHIVLPNIFNENYTHNILFKNANGSIYEDATFTLKTVICVSPNPDEMDNLSSIQVVAAAGTVIIDDRLIDRVVTAYIVDDVSKNTGFTKPIASNTLTLVDGNVFEENATVTIIFQ